MKMPAPSDDEMRAWLPGSPTPDSAAGLPSFVSRLRRWLEHLSSRRPSASRQPSTGGKARSARDAHLSTPSSCTTRGGWTIT